MKTVQEETSLGFCERLDAYQFTSCYNVWRIYVYKFAEDPTKPPHRLSYTGEGMSDVCSCSCGWESSGYWDGQEYAFDEWVKHLGAMSMREWARALVASVPGGIRQ